MARPLSNDLRTSILEIGILPIKLQTHKINVDLPGGFYETFEGRSTLLRIKNGGQLFSMWSPIPQNQRGDTYNICNCFYDFTHVMENKILSQA